MKEVFTNIEKQETHTKKCYRHTQQQFIELLANDKIIKLSRAVAIELLLVDFLYVPFNFFRRLSDVENCINCRVGIDQHTNVNLSKASRQEKWKEGKETFFEKYSGCKSHSGRCS